MLGLTPFKMGLPLVLVLLTTNPAISIGPWVQHALHSERDGRRGLQASDPRGLVSTLATFSDARYSIAVSPDGAFALMVVGISNGGRILKITLANNNVTTLIVAGSGSVKGYADGLTVMVRMRNSLTTAWLACQSKSGVIVPVVSAVLSGRPMPCRCMC